MEQVYWLRRESEEVSRASSATNVKAREIHVDLANRYGAKAAEVGRSRLPHSGETSMHHD